MKETPEMIAGYKKDISKKHRRINNCGKRIKNMEILVAIKNEQIRRDNHFKATFKLFFPEQYKQIIACYEIAGIQHKKLRDLKKEMTDGICNIRNV